MKDVIYISEKDGTIVPSYYFEAKGYVSIDYIRSNICTFFCPMSSMAGYDCQFKKSKDCQAHMSIDTMLDFANHEIN